VLVDASVLVHGAEPEVAARLVPLLVLDRVATCAAVEHEVAGLVGAGLNDAPLAAFRQAGLRWLATEDADLRRAGEIQAELTNGQTIRATRSSHAAAPGEPVVVLIRPEDMSFCAGEDRTGAYDVLAGTVRDLSYHGDTFKLAVAVGKEVLKIRVARMQGAGVVPGEPVLLTWKSNAAKVLPATDRTEVAADGAQR